MRIAKRFIADSCGAPAVEYGFIVGLIALAAMGSMSAFSDVLGNTLMLSTNTMTNAPGILGKG